MSMKVDIVRRTRIASAERADMHAVFSRYYENADPTRFEADLDAKNWVIQFRNQAQNIVGFLTLQTYQHCGSCGSVVILYSGDTIIDRAYRNTGYLAGAFGHLMLRAIELSDGLSVYWLLTSKGVRTYRFLPVFFKTFFPVFNQQTPPDMKRLIDEVATAKFGAGYSPATQVVSHAGQRDWLRASEHNPLLIKRPDEHIRFFLSQNPGYAGGDELVCITQVAAANLNSRAKRVIEHTEVNWRE